MQQPPQKPQSGQLNPEDTPRLVYRPKPKELEESKTQDPADHFDDDHASEVQYRNPQNQPAHSDRAGPRHDVKRHQRRDVVMDSAQKAQDAYIKEMKEKEQSIKAFQNANFQGTEITEDVKIIMDKFENSSENTVFMELLQIPITHGLVDPFQTFTRVDKPTFNIDCPIDLQEYLAKMEPMIIAAQLLRHIYTQSAERRAESEPFTQLQQVELYLPQSVNSIIEMLGQVSTNAGQIALVPKSGMRQLAAAAISSAVRQGIYEPETSILTIRDRLAMQAETWDPLKVISEDMTNNKDLVTAIIKDFQIPRTARVQTQSNFLVHDEGQQPPPPLVLNYEAQTFLNFQKNIQCQPLRDGLNEINNQGEIIALKYDRNNLLRLQACGYTIALDTPDEQLVSSLQKMIANWNTHVAPLNTKIFRSAVSKTGGGCAHQAIPMSGSQTKGHIVFNENDYSVAALQPVCYKTFTYIDKFRQQGIKQDKMLDDFILQVIRK